MAWWFDRPLLNALTRDWDAASISEYPDRIRKHEEAMPAPIVAAMQNIDGKATGLLTHVSMMIAGLGLVAPLVADHRIEQGVIVFEMAIYLLLAVGCLRCLNVFNPHQLSGELSGMTNALGRELLLRRELYAFCVRAAIIFTLVIVATLPIMFFY